MEDDTQKPVLVRRYTVEETGKSVFFVAVCSHPKNERSRHRLWGWYTKFEDAEKAVLENHTDIFEDGYYEHAVIEEIPEGVCATAKEVWFYEAVYKDEPREFGKSYDPVIRRVDRPEWAEGIFNLTL